MICSHCQHSNPAGRKFCSQCGTPFPSAEASTPAAAPLSAQAAIPVQAPAALAAAAPAPAVAPAAGHCPHCQAPHRAQAKFCPQCGSMLGLKPMPLVEAPNTYHADIVDAGTSPPDGPPCTRAA